MQLKSLSLVTDRYFSMNEGEHNRLLLMIIIRVQSIRWQVSLIMKLFLTLGQSAMCCHTKRRLSVSIDTSPLDFHYHSHKSLWPITRAIKSTTRSYVVFITKPRQMFSFRKSPRLKFSQRKCSSEAPMNRLKKPP